MVVLIRKLRDVLVTIFDASDPAHCLKRFDLNDAGNISRSIENSNLKYQTEEFFKFFCTNTVYILFCFIWSRKKGWKMVARDCFVKQETPSIQIPKFYLNSLHKDTSFKKISQFVNAETILISLYLAQAMINPDARCQCWLKIHIVSWSRFSQVGSKLGIN